MNKYVSLHRLLASIALSTHAKFHNLLVMIAANAQDCLSVSVFNKKNGSPAIVNGKQIFFNNLIGTARSEWIRPGEKDDTFSFGISYTAHSPQYTVGIVASPVGGVDILETNKKIVNSTHDEYTFKTECRPLMSYRLTVSHVMHQCLDDYRNNICIILPILEFHLDKSLWDWRSK